MSTHPPTLQANIKRICYNPLVNEGRKRVLLIAAILAARKLAQFDGGKRGSGNHMRHFRTLDW
jgi:hypothetical protein